MKISKILKLQINEIIRENYDVEWLPSKLEKVPRIQLYFQMVSYFKVVAGVFSCYFIRFNLLNGHADLMMIFVWLMVCTNHGACKNQCYYLLYIS